jgi:hypothetical protein
MLASDSTPAPSPASAPRGRRFAILFAGAADRNHLNDLELSYRMLVNAYKFDPQNIFVLFHDGTRGENGGPFVDPDTGDLRKWPGDGSSFQIVLNDEGSTAAFRRVLSTLATTKQLQPDDLVFIHTEGHGNHEELAPSEDVYLCTYPESAQDPQQYFARELGVDLAQLPPCRALLVLMNQCYAGGFSVPVLNGSRAAATSIACAATADELAYAAITMNLRWNDFSLDWMEAQMRQHFNHTQLQDGPANNGDGAVEADEAYKYAVRHSEGRDSPNYAARPEPAGDEISLGAA